MNEKWDMIHLPGVLVGLKYKASVLPAGQQP